MSIESAVLGAGPRWLLECWLEKFRSVLGSMTEQSPSITWDLEGEQELGEGALLLEQRCAGVAEPILWLGVPASVHQELGGSILSAAGLEKSDEEENRATCVEAVEQSLTGLTAAIAQRVNRELTREQVQTCPFFPSGLTVIHVTVALGKTQLTPIWIAFSPSVIAWAEEKPAEPVAQQLIEQEEEPERDILGTSRTFELLLDVALPVSVSFGKTELLVKDVLKLTTGSIVELNRSISEPVDIIVNGCIIARGEVVVVDGNYGVRVNNIISRKDRLRTGGAAAETRIRVGGQG